MQQALALIIFGVLTAVQRVHHKSADGEKPPTTAAPKMALRGGGDAEKGPANRD